MRLDKLLSNASNLTRSQAVKAIRQGDVLVDGEIVTKGAEKVTEENQVTYLGVPISEPKPRYYMLNKPIDCVSANKDKNSLTVFDYLTVPRRDQLHVAGRLDKDTTGLILATDDGQWSHRLTSPKHEHTKRYRVTLSDEITRDAIQQLEQGVACIHHVTIFGIQRFHYTTLNGIDVIRFFGKNHPIDGNKFLKLILLNGCNGHFTAVDVQF